MGEVALLLTGLALLLAPVALACIGVWAEGRGERPASETLLLGLISLPVVMIVAMVALGTLAPGRPYDSLLEIQLAFSIACGGVAYLRRAALTRTFRDLRRGARTAWSEAAWPLRAVILVGVGLQGFAIGYGAWATPWAADELSYHLPMALQALQDGRLGPVQANIVWADSYPRALELLYSWTMILLRLDAGVHPVNAVFGWGMMLCTYVAGRRVGLTGGWALSCAGLIATAPIFFYLSIQGYIDLCVSACIAAGVTFGLPRRDGGWDTRSLAGVVIALTLAWWMKFSAIAAVLLVIGFVGLRAIIATIRRDARFEPRLRTVVAAASLVLALGSLAYVRTTLVYGSPSYPVNLEIAGITIFEGPMDPTKFGRQNDLPRLERYTAFWSSWHDAVNADSRGAFGPLFGLLLILAALFGSVDGVLRRDPGRLLLALVFWTALFIPEHHIPRYATYILLPGVLFAALLGKAIDDAGHGRSFAIVLLLLQLYNFDRVHDQIDRKLSWSRDFRLPLMTRYGDRTVFDVHQRYNTTLSAAPETRRVLYGLMNDGETLAAAVQDVFSVLYDRDYRYRVEHRPARTWPYWHNHVARPLYGLEEGPVWLDGLVRDGIDAVLVYSDSAEDRTLREAPEHFTALYAQPEEAGGQPMVIYRRSE